MSHILQSQDEVFGLLADPTTHGGEAVHRFNTHLSAVFLAGPRAYKVKRAAQFPFVDFSTLEKRKAACEKEIDVNRPYAPEIYRRIVAITREPDGRLALDGKGEPVEWAVEMLRFDEDQTLDRLADRGKIDAHVADALGRAVAAAHRDMPAVDAEPWIGALSSFIAQNDEAFRERPALFPAADAMFIREASEAALARLHPLLSRRGARGLVRRCHGDLHLGNIVMLDDRPVLFDAIEFSPLIASGDVLYDLAFLLMDMANRALPAAANIAFNRYLVETVRADRDAMDAYDGLAALPLFLSLRAAIRAKVTAARLESAEPSEHDAIREGASRYFELAVSLLKPARPRLVAVGGLSGTGKSVLAKALAPDLPPVPGAVLLRSDVERKLLFGRGETEHLPAEAYTADVSAKVYTILQDKARHALAAGHSVVVDAVFARRGERDAVGDVARSCAAGFRGLFLTADLAVRLTRVGGRGPDASDANAEVVRQQESYAVGSTEWANVDASGTPDETLGRARSVLSDAASD